MVKKSSGDTQKDKMKLVLSAIKAMGNKQEKSRPKSMNASDILHYIARGGRPRSSHAKTPRPDFLSPKVKIRTRGRSQSSGNKKIVKVPISDISAIFSKMKLKENNPPIKNSVVKK